MPAFDLSLMVALAALVFSVLSPILSSLIDAIARIREKELEFRMEMERRDREFYMQHRTEVIERYLKYVGRLCKIGTRTDLNEFGASMGEIYLYVDESLWPLLDAIELKLNTAEYSPPTKEFVELCKALSSEKIYAKRQFPEEPTKEQEQD